MLTYTGKIFDILKPFEGDRIELLDVAHGLSNICRFGGQSSFFYSVAEHSYHCSTIPVDQWMKMWMLLHDAHEAFVGDIIRPIKWSFPDPSIIGNIEDQANRFVHSCLGVAMPVEDSETLMKEIDNRMLITEANVLFEDRTSGGRIDWVDVPPYDHIKIVGYKPRVAEYMFITRFQDLMEELK